ncbi:MAG: hypothetical protein H3C32_10945 [Anaerolineae bacterium]|nr:hypothetical protein [Anaerolineae bacterium]
MSAEDRLQLLLNQSALTGIDFVYVYASQDRLDVFFLRAPETLDVPLPGSLPRSAVRIENVRDANVPDVIITSVSWAVVDGRTVMRLDVVRPASFAPHRLTLTDPAAPSRIDPFFSSKVFSFQANCETGLDCEPDDPLPLPETYVDFPVDYSARDFHTFRQALLDYASQRYPQWLDRLEADVGVMLVEVMAALGDELAYSQDAISREAYLATASQRRSLRQLARLVDYEPFDGQSASTLLDITCNPGENGVVPTGTPVSDADGVFTFEVGAGLFDTSAGYTVDSARNRFLPYFWDEDDVELSAGSTELAVAGAGAAAFPPISGGRLILLATNPADASDPAQRVLVHLQSAVDDTDPLTGDPICRLTWDEPTPYRLDKTALEVRGNIVPATAGATRQIAFSIGTPEDPEAPAEHAIVRRGPDGIPIYRFSLPGTDEFGVAHVFDADVGSLRAEVRLYRAQNVGGSWEPIWTEEWEWRLSLLGTASSTRFDQHFTLEDGMWGRVVGYPVSGGESVHEDYLAAGGYTIRFGDGEFGMIPPDNSVFVAIYRLNTSDNLPRHVLTRADDAPSFIQAVTNPVAATGALPPETAGSIRANAPEAFRIAHRAVKPEDYAEAVERLDWVQNAGASMRWTGSWRTIFVSADLFGAVDLTPAQIADMDAQIDRFRQAGQDAQRRPARYADIDIEVEVCAEPSSYAGAVKEDVIDALVGGGGFFSPDNFTFGTRLYRGALEAAIAAVPGVRAVESIEYRRRGWFDWQEFAPASTYYDPGIDTIIRVQHDALYPERGTLRVSVRGGA